MGNAGTAARLMMGLLAPYPYQIHFSGDASLSKRPMKSIRLVMGVNCISGHLLSHYWFLHWVQ